MTYAEKLKDPRWQRKRLEIMERDDFSCRYCRSGKITLNVHHRIYRKGAAPWDYDDEVFVTLCESCHKKAEDSKEAVLLSMGSNRLHDDRMVLLAEALEPKETNLTFWGWAVESLSNAISNQLFLEKGTTSATTDEIVHHIELDVFTTIRHMMYALTHSERKNRIGKSSERLSRFDSLIHNSPENP